MDVPWKRQAAPAGPDFIASLDLGQVRDPSALAVLERTRGADARGRRAYHYAGRYLHRWALGTAYSGTREQPGIAEDVGRLLGQLPARPALVVDQTGVGRAVVDVLRKAQLPVAKLVPVTITPGSGPGGPAAGGGGWTVPKRTLASVLHALLGTRRLQVSPSLPLAAVLTRELETFSVKINLATGEESFEALRSRDHDDLCLALALGAWFGEYQSRSIILGL
jgi:hypothetical protein